MLALCEPVKLVAWLSLEVVTLQDSAEHFEKVREGSIRLKSSIMTWQCKFSRMIYFRITI